MSCALSNSTRLLPRASALEAAHKYNPENTNPDVPNEYNDKYAREQQTRCRWVADKEPSSLCSLFQLLVY